MSQVRRKDSLYFQLLILLIIAATFAALLFGGLNAVGRYVIDRSLNSEYMGQRSEKYIAKLQSYVTKNQVNVTDTQKLTTWVKKQSIVNIEVYMDDILYYDSEYPNQQDIWNEEIVAQYYEWNNYYTVQFADGEAVVNIYGLYDYQLYNYAVFAAIILSFIVFLIIVIWGIRGKMKYIMNLSEEIEILEGGDLDYSITVKGKDELAVLAKGLDEMRQSFQNQVNQEAQMVQENQRIITEMSHDLRTPITSMMLYLTILKRGESKDEEQLELYLDKIESKASQMKQLTDHLFEYSLVTGDSTVELDAPVPMESVFYDLLSETSCYLEQKEFEVQTNFIWTEEQIQICMDYITRILDNISSNIIKYADCGYPVVISTFKEDSYVGIQFENRALHIEEKADSTEIGVQSMKNMMRNMNGLCRVDETDGNYRIQILFPAQ